MEDLKLINVTERIKKAQEIRKENIYVPGIIYNKENNINIQIKNKELLSLVDECIYTKIFKVNLNNETYKVKFMELQRDTVSSKIIHFDLKIVENELLSVNIPVFVNGIIPTNYRVKLPNRTIKAKCSANDLVDKIEFSLKDISENNKISTDNISKIKKLNGITFTKKQDIVITKIKT